MRHRILGAWVASLLLILTGSARAQHYGSSGIQLFGAPIVGVYKYPAGVASPGYGYGYAPAGYSAPAYSAPMMAPVGGCTGFPAFSSPGYPAYSAPAYSAPMMAAGGGCNGYSAFANHGFSAPGYGYGSGYGAPQQGFFPVVGAAGGILETIRLIKEIRTAFDELRGGGGSGDPASRDEIKKLSDRIDSLQAKVDRVPADVEGRLTKLTDRLEKLEGVDLLQIDKRLKALEKK